MGDFMNGDFLAAVNVNAPRRGKRRRGGRAYDVERGGIQTAMGVGVAGEVTQVASGLLLTVGDDGTLPKTANADRIEGYEGPVSDIEALPVVDASCAYCGPTIDGRDHSGCPAVDGMFGGAE